MDPETLHVTHCGDEVAEAVPDGDGGWRVRCPGCGRAFVVAEDDGTPEVRSDGAEPLVRIEPFDPFADATPAERLRVLLRLAYGAADRLRAIETLCASWYDDLAEAEDGTMHRVTDLFVAGDHVYATLEFGEGECRFDGRGVLVSEPTLVFVWTFAWGPGTRLAGEVEARLIERFGRVTPEGDDLGPFVPVLAWWSPGLWRVGFLTRISASVDADLVGVAARATRGLARRVASLALDPAAPAPVSGGKG